MSFASDPKVLGAVAERAFAELHTARGTGGAATARRIGLGTGRASEAFIVRLGAAVRGGLSVVGVPTSERSAKLAAEHGIPTGTLAEGRLEIAFDGADEVDPAALLTKGLGGAMLRERVVAAEADRFIVLVTADKLVPSLGARSPLPVEVVPFAIDAATRRLARLCKTVVVRKKAGGAAPFVTDNGNLVLDLHAGEGGWADPRTLDASIRATPGIVDTGFFFGMASLVIVGSAEGVKTLSPP